MKKILSFFIAFFCLTFFIMTNKGFSQDVQSFNVPYEKKYTFICFQHKGDLYVRLIGEGYKRFAFSFVDGYYKNPETNEITKSRDVVELWIDSYKNMRIIHTNPRGESCVMADSYQLSIDDLDALFGKSEIH